MADKWDVHEVVLENLVGDLEFHPKRALVYLALGAFSFAVWFFLPLESKADVVPLLLGTGSVTLVLKGIFLMRKTSDGLAPSRPLFDLSAQASASPQRPAPKKFPSTPALVAQVIQDFGAGGMFGGVILHKMHDFNEFLNNLPAFSVIAVGGVLFGAGWAVRKMSSLVDGTPV